jgi:signal transduction histidine kinase
MGHGARAVAVPLAVRRPRVRWRPETTAAAGLTGALTVAYVTASNPAAGPGDLAVALRVGIIGLLTVAAVYAQRGEHPSRMGQPLGSTVVLASLCLLNGSDDSFLFSVGVLASLTMPVVVAYLALAHPTGRLRTPADRRFLLWSGAAFVTAALITVLITGQLPVRTPFVGCVPHCPANVLSLEHDRSVPAVLKACVAAAWLTMALGTVVLLHRRGRSAPPALRPILLPVRAWATLAAVILVAFLTVRLIGTGSEGATGIAYVASAALLPLAVLAGLAMERMFMGEALAHFIRQLGITLERDPQGLISETVGDPSLRIAYPRPDAPGAYVDSSGAPVAVGEGAGGRAVSWLHRDGQPLAAVLYDSELRDQEPFIQALGAAALIRLERAHLQADLVASTRELAASRVRLIEAADAERRRLERDLHDGVQQQLLGVRIKLDRAADAIRTEPTEGQRMLASVGRQIDDVLASLRSLARGIYPTILTERGLADAIRSAARNSPQPVTVRATGLGRYPHEVEVAVYFCCLEALQNVAKHAGAGVPATVQLWQEDATVCFEVRDGGAGFDWSTIERGRGLTNMRDRLEAIGGHLTVTSAPGAGTAVAGRVAVA